MDDSNDNSRTGVNYGLPPDTNSGHIRLAPPYGLARIDEGVMFHLSGRLEGEVFQVDHAGSLICTNPGVVSYSLPRQAAVPEKLENENEHLRAALKGGYDIGLTPDQCREALSKCRPRD